MELGFDAKALGRQYLERAAQLDPQLRGVREALAVERQRTSPDELLTLIYRAHEGYMLAEYQQDHSKEPEKAPERWERSKKAAEDTLTLAAKSPDHPNAGAAIYGANVALATHALRAGNRQEAVRPDGRSRERLPPRRALRRRSSTSSCGW